VRAAAIEKARKGFERGGETGDPAQHRGTSALVDVAAFVEVVVRGEDPGIEPVPGRDGALQLRLATSDELANARDVGTRRRGAPLGVDHASQPALARHRPGLHEDAAQKAVDRADVERLERCGQGVEAILQFEDLGVGERRRLLGRGLAGRDRRSRPGRGRPALRRRARTFGHRAIVANATPGADRWIVDTVRGWRTTAPQSLFGERGCPATGPALWNNRSLPPAPGAVRSARLAPGLLAQRSPRACRVLHDLRRNIMGATEAFASTAEIGHFIDGKPVAGTSGRRQAVFNPATGGVARHVALASAAEVDAAVAA